MTTDPVIVTGACGGIGRAVVDAFVAAGRAVLAVDLPEVAHPGDTDLVAHVGHDVTDSDGAAAAVAACVDRWGSVHGLVNLVGGGGAGRRVDELPPNAWDDAIRANLTSAYLMCHHAMTHLEASKGTIVNVSSAAGIRGMKLNPAYCAAKAGLIGFTRALALDHAPRGVRANGVAPGPVATPLLRSSRSVEEIAAIGRQALVGRVAEPAEIADVIVFLSGANSTYLVGETLLVDGGLATIA